MGEHLRQHGGRIDAQEGIAGQFVGKRAGEGRRALLAHRRYVLLAAPQRLIVRIDHARERGIGLGVFVAAAHQGVRGQGCQADERAQHVGGRALEQAPAPQTK